MARWVVKVVTWMCLMHPIACGALYGYWNDVVDKRIGFRNFDIAIFCNRNVGCQLTEDAIMF